MPRKCWRKLAPTLTSIRSFTPTFGIGRDVLVEVRIPRTPCENLSARMGDPDFHKHFARSGRVGAYLKVIEGGSIEAGDRIIIGARPDHGLTIGGYYDRPGPDLMRGVLACGVDLVESARRRAQRIAARGRS